MAPITVGTELDRGKYFRAGPELPSR